MTCCRCGLRRLDPRPTPDLVRAHYGEDYNAFAGRVRSRRKQALWDLLRDASSEPDGLSGAARTARPVLGPVARRIFDIDVSLHGRRGLRVLDVGSGFGDLLIYLRDRGCEVQGVDPEPRAAARAAEYGVPVHVGDIHSLEAAERSFDIAILSHSLEHVPDPRAVLARVHGLLVEGGRAHIAVPSGASAGLRCEGLEWGHLSYPLHLWYFDPANLAAIAEAAGLRPIGWRTRITWGFHRGALVRRRRRDGAGEAIRQAACLAGDLAHRAPSGDVLSLTAFKPEADAPLRSVSAVSA